MVWRWWIDAINKRFGDLSISERLMNGEGEEESLAKILLAEVSKQLLCNQLVHAAWSILKWRKE